MVYSVQYLRALAALLVVVAHSLHKVGQLSSVPIEGFTLGDAGVDLFFIISGFVMCHVSANKSISPVNFMRARLVRILPLYWLLTCAALVVFLINPGMVNSSGGVTTLVHSFTLFPVGQKLLIQNGWTLSYEFWFYLIFALGLQVQGAARLAIVSVIIVGLVALGMWLKPLAPALSFATQPLLLEFLMGCAAYGLIRREWLGRPAYLLILVLGLAGAVVANNCPGSASRVLLWGVPMMAVFIGCVGLEAWFRQWAEHAVGRLLKGLGDASYSLYLSHPFAISTVAVLLKKSGLQHYTLLSVIALVVASWVAGQLCYVFVEKPLLKRFRHWGQPRQQDTHAAVTPLRP
ncbi:acyltransferase family protein [Pseudomonas abieticivorans]|uniref:acyltransferase family protein n=1 Tax=Pseudomonas abieticivorans TaxID=2931382 RepID=UPI0024BEB6E5|nr:acyltransferase [Pseudomonas sp. PIA16]